MTYEFITGTENDYQTIVDWLITVRDELDDDQLDKYKFYQDIICKLQNKTMTKSYYDFLLKEYPEWRI